MYKRILIIPALVISLSVPLTASAAVIFFGAAQKEVGIDLPQEIGVFINTEREEINAFEGTVALKKSEFKIQEVLTGNSIVNFWIQDPNNSVVCKEDVCTVSWRGMITGGYRGEKGYLFSIVAVPVTAGDVSIHAGSLRVLKADGEGTAVQTSESPLILAASATPKDGSSFLPSFDIVPPEAFFPEVNRDPNILDGKWFLVFSTQDKNSGVDHYEVRENGIFGGSWEKATSPYVLHDQALASNIEVKSIDKAKNTRLVTISAPNHLARYTNYGILGVILLVLIVFFSLAWRTHRNKKQQS